ncbi:MAG: DUF11 domain-containing protein [Saprospiraceae bacterium]|nr:DUF11 domain-containing protein [Saprospiraceae bacterium]
MKNLFKTFCVIVCCIFCIQSSAQIQGKAFIDINGNGIQDTDPIENNVSNVTVNIYDSLAILRGTGATGSNGMYSITPSGVPPYRIEFILPSGMSFLKPGSAGNIYGTTVRFLNSSTQSNVNLAIFEAGNFSSTTNPSIATVRNFMGEITGVMMNTSSVLKTKYLETGHNFMGESTLLPSGSTDLSRLSKVGCAYGVANHSSIGKIYVSAYHKRFGGFGPFGPDAIYQLDTSGGIVGVINLDSTISVVNVTGSDVHDFVVRSFMPTGSGFYDLGPGGVGYSSFDGAGKRSIGDIEMSGDEKSLFVVNLFTREIYSLDVSSGNPGSTMLNFKWNAPDATSAGRHRPFGLKWYKNKLYIGSVDQNGSNAFVHSFDPTVASPTFNLELTIPLTYNRQEFIYTGGNSNWNPWQSAANAFTPLNNGRGEIAYPQAMLSDIEFDAKGNMILGFRDRFGDQAGFASRFDYNETTNKFGTAAGDILRACLNSAGTGWILEGNLLCPTSGGLLNSGPGGLSMPEHYEWDFWQLKDPLYTWDASKSSGGYHFETTQGSLLQVPGSSVVMSTAMDPMNDYSGGLLRLINETGEREGAPLLPFSGQPTTGGYTLFDTGEYVGRPPNPNNSFAKGNGLGDVEILGEAPPMEIGNRVWAEWDGDGIQDPGEIPLANVIVKLKKADGTLLATALTDNNGNYYFSNGRGTSNTSSIYNISMLMQNRDYCIVIPDVKGTKRQSILKNHNLTLSDVGGTGQADGRDNDGQPVGDSAVVCFRSGDLGDNNHNFDFGFQRLPVPAFDLALTKAVSPMTPAPYKPGDLVKYNITITNQGQLDAYNIIVTDYIPTGMSLEDPNWSGTTKATLNSPIAKISPNSSETVSITLRINSSFQGIKLRNWAEISSADDDTDSANTPPSDLDSDPDQSQFGPGPGETDDLNDDNVISGNGLAGGDEDDHDPAEIDVTQTFDLALRKIFKSGTVALGGNVTYTITIFNQGTLDATNVKIADYYPTGLTLAGSGWSNANPSINSTGINVPAGGNVSIDIHFNISATYSGYKIRNWAEISSASNALSFPDIDSDPDLIQFGLGTGESNDLLDDDKINENGKSGEDEDDHDPAEVTLPKFDLALKLTTVTPTPYSYGQLIEFNIMVCNQGDESATMINLVNYIPSGFTFDNIANPDWDFDGVSKATFMVPSILPTGECVNKNIFLRVKPGSGGGNLYTNRAEIKSAKDSRGIVVPDADSKPDDIVGNDTGGVPGSSTDNQMNEEPPVDEDDEDPELIEIFDLALMNMLTNPLTGPYSYNQVHTYTLTICNQGNIDAYNIELKNYVPYGYKFTEGSGWFSIPRRSEFDGPGMNRYFVTGPLVAGTCSDVSLTLTTIPVATPTKKSWINYSEIVSAEDIKGVSRADVDSRYGSNTTNETAIMPGQPGDNDKLSNSDSSVGSEDDHDPAGPEIVDLALINELASTGSFKYGDKVTYKFTVFNQGSVAMSEIDIKAIFSNCYSIDLSVNQGWAKVGDKYKYTFSTPLMPGEMIMTTLMLTVNKCSSNPKDYVVFGEISKVLDEKRVNRSMDDMDSMPDSDTPAEKNTMPGDVDDNDPLTIDKNGREDDHDPAGIEIFDVALRKTIVNNTVVKKGEIVLFKIEVFNQGTVDGYNIKIVDDIPDGYEISSTDPNGWILLSGNKYEKEIPVLLKGTSTSVFIELKIKPGTNLQNLKNVAEISSAKNAFGVLLKDADSDPDEDVNNEIKIIDDEIDNPNDEDDQDFAIPLVIDLALKKTIESSPRVSIGDIVKYAVDVYNQGNVPAQNVVILDYMNDAYEFIPGMNPDWSISGGHIIHKMNSAILPGGHDKFYIFLKVTDKATSENLINSAEIYSMEDMAGSDMSSYDIDSDPDEDSENDPGGELMGPSDNAIHGNGKGVIGGGTAEGDEDDEDVASVFICLPIACKERINFSIDESCTGILTPSMLLAQGTLNPMSFTITVKDEKNKPHENVFGINDAGKSYIVTIKDTICGNSCWTNVWVEDKLGPIILCDSDTLICLEYENHDLGVEVLKECSTYDLKMVKSQELNYFCDEKYIKKLIQHWAAIDVWGNSSDICMRELLFERISFDSIISPENIELDCSRVQYDNNGRIDPALSGVPTFNGRIELYPNRDFHCGIFVDFDDEDLEIISCQKRVLRTWEVIEWWCSSEIRRTWQQLITIVDKTGPEIQTRHMDFSVTTNSKSCSAVVELPKVQAIEVCNSLLRSEISYPGGILSNSNGGSVSLPLGENIIVYKFYDNCYNVSEDTILITVLDQQSPVAICDRRSVVSINHSGLVYVAASAFDNGSFDECKLDRFEVQRMDLNSCNSVGEDSWGQEVHFCCNDIGKEVLISLKAIDASGNESTCMISVEVQDKEQPQISCPPHIEVDCRFSFDYLNLSNSFGKVVIDELDRDTIVIDGRYWHYFVSHPIDGIAKDNCELDIIETIDTSGLNQCGMGILIRKFVAMDPLGARDSCTQRITIDNHNPMSDLNINWPDDFDTTNICDAGSLRPELLTQPFNFPVFSDDECSLVGMDYEDHILSSTIPGQPCYKILREWKVIDWCFRDRLGNILIFRDTQIITVRNTVAPIITKVCRDTTICSYDTACKPILVNLHIDATDFCTNVNELVYKYKIDLNHDGTFDIVNSQIGSGAISGIWPIGNHIIKWEVEDKCGNVDTCQSQLNLLNCKPPTAYAHKDLAIGLVAVDTDGDGTPDRKLVTVWAEDLDAGSYHSCGLPLRFSFSKDTADRFRIYSCDSIGPKNVQLWITDPNGNTSFVNTIIIINDNPQQDPRCPTRAVASVSGQLLTEKQEGMERIEVHLDNSVKGNTVSDLNGVFKFGEMPVGGKYSIRPYNNEDWLNGVSTSDIVRIQKHILGKKLLTTPFQMIAADVNNSKGITSADISELRKLILGSIQEVAKNTSWRFIDNSYKFKNIETALTEPFNEVVNISTLKDDVNATFIGVKIGDIDGNAAVNSNVNTFQRTNKPMVLSLMDQKVTKGEIEEWNFSVTNLKEFSGLQACLEIDSDAVEIIEVIGNSEIGMGMENFNLNYLNFGKILLSWNGETDAGTNALFTVLVRTKKDGFRSHFLKINDKLLKPISVDKLGEENGVQLEFRNSNFSDFVVYQNYPNPWKNSTSLKIIVPEQDEVRLTISDIEGRVIYNQTKQMIKGQNVWNLNRSIIPVSGIYIYQVDYKTRSFSNRMVIIN